MNLVLVELRNIKMELHTYKCKEPYGFVQYLLRDSLTSFLRKFVDATVLCPPEVRPPKEYRIW